MVWEWITAKVGSRVPRWVGTVVLTYRREKRSVQATQDAVARNLEYNAEATGRYIGGGGIQTTMEMLDLTAWSSYERELHILSRRDPQLWSDLTAAYQALAITKVRGAHPPHPDHLNDLARRLRDAKL